MTIARYYDASKNPENATLPGVPLADISQHDWDDLPPWLQASVDDKPWYRKTPPPTTDTHDAARSTGSSRKTIAEQQDGEG